MAKRCSLDALTHAEGLWDAALSPSHGAPRPGALEEGPMRRSLQACIAYHGSTRPYAGADTPGRNSRINIRPPPLTFN